MVATLKAEARDGLTKSEVKKLRSGGKVPAVVYGKKVGARSIFVDAKELLALLRQNQHAVMELDIPDSGKHPVMVHDVQRDKVYRNLLHVDFHQINLDEPVRTSVPLEFDGEPKGAQEGGMFQVQMHEIEIRCLPHLIPGAVHVNVAGMELGDMILVKDITLPEGIEMKSDPDDVVATLLALQKGTDEPEAEAGDGNKAKNVKEAAEPVS